MLIIAPFDLFGVMYETMGVKNGNTDKRSFSSCTAILLAWDIQ
jgi:hypothetical protein